MLTYNEARLLMESARNKANGKPLQNNTRLFEKKRRVGEREETYYTVRFHSTDIVEIYPNGTYGVRTNGWETITTAQRIRDYSPLGWGSPGVLLAYMADDKDWLIRFRPRASDPYPDDHLHIEVPKPARRPPEPGPAPRSEDFGECWAGHRVSTTEWIERTTFYPRDLRPNDRPYFPGYSAGPDPGKQPTRARAVLTFIDAVESGYGLHVRRLHTTVTDYISDYPWRHPTPGIGRFLKQCQHCLDLHAATQKWDRAVKRMSYYTSNVELYGSEDAWRAEWRDDRRLVIDANKRRSAWSERNHMPLTGLIHINRDGYPLVSEERWHRSRAYARRCSDNRLRREQLKREAYERQLERFRRGLQRKRRRGFIELAAETAIGLQSIRERIGAAPTTNES